MKAPIAEAVGAFLLGLIVQRTAFEQQEATL